jgi:hypothetical protein
MTRKKQFAIRTRCRDAERRRLCHRPDIKRAIAQKWLAFNVLRSFSAFQLKSRVGKPNLPSSCSPDMAISLAELDSFGEARMPAKTKSLR